MDTTDRLKLLGDPTRVRLLALLSTEELTVVEIVEVTRLVQSRVSSHLGRLREAGLLRLRRAGPSAYYAVDETGLAAVGEVWTWLQQNADDGVLDEDRRRVRTVLRSRGGTWADSVAGRMERHYSPGRTWEAAARALIGLARLGDVLDIASGDGALAELIAPRARSVTCVDSSARVVDAGVRRLGNTPDVRFQVGDMHALPFADGRFDHALLINSLSYATDPVRVVTEAGRVLKGGGDLVVVALRAHRHDAVAANYNHVQRGFKPAALAAMLDEAGFDVSTCEVTSRERRSPHFEVITAYASRRGTPGGPGAPS